MGNASTLMIGMCLFTGVLLELGLLELELELDF